MKRSTKYVALDVHQATTVTSVREPSGRVIARSILPTEAAALVEYCRGMRGAIHVAFEESTQAQWLHDVPAPVVHRVIVCDRRGDRRGNKADHKAADRLSHRLLTGDLLRSTMAARIGSRCRSSRARTGTWWKIRRV